MLLQLENRHHHTKIAKIELDKQSKANAAELLKFMSEETPLAESATRALLPEGAFPADRRLPNWVRLLANFPKAVPARVATLRLSETKGDLPARLNAQLAWVSARARCS